MTEWHHRESGPITEEKLVRAVHILADIVEKHGPAFRPLYQDCGNNWPNSACSRRPARLRQPEPHRA